MNKYAILIIIFNLISCNKKEIILPKITHLDLFDLKGSVKKIRYNFEEYEITENSYAKKGRFTPLKNGLILFDFDCNLEYPKILSDFSNNKISLDKFEAFDSFNITINNINDYVYSKDCDAYELEFNQEGFLTLFTGIKDGEIIFKKALAYDNQNKIIEVQNFSEKQIWKNTYKYNSENLLVESNINGDFKSLNKYEYKWISENEIEEKNSSYNGVIKKSKIILNKDKVIDEITNDDFSNLKFKNGLVSSRNEYFKNKLHFASDFEYKDNILTKVKISRPNELDDMSYKDYDFKYNEMKNLIGINETSKQNSENIKFEYDYDEFKNWTKQTYGRDRVIYDNQKNKVNKLIEMNKSSYELYGYPAFSFSESENEYKRLSLAQMLCSKIVVNRIVTYY